MRSQRWTLNVSDISSNLSLRNWTDLPSEICPLKKSPPLTQLSVACRTTIWTVPLAIEWILSYTDANLSIGRVHKQPCIKTVATVQQMIYWVLCWSMIYLDTLLEIEIQVTGKSVNVIDASGWRASRTEAVELMGATSGIRASFRRRRREFLGRVRWTRALCGHRRRQAHVSDTFSDRIAYFAQKRAPSLVAIVGEQIDLALGVVCCAVWC